MKLEERIRISYSKNFPWRMEQHKNMVIEHEYRPNEKIY